MESQAKATAFRPSRAGTSLSVTSTTSREEAVTDVMSGPLASCFVSLGVTMITCGKQLEAKHVTKCLNSETYLLFLLRLRQIEGGAKNQDRMDEC